MPDIRQDLKVFSNKLRLNLPIMLFQHVFLNIPNPFAIIREKTAELCTLEPLSPFFTLVCCHGDTFIGKCRNRPVDHG